MSSTLHPLIMAVDDEADDIFLLRRTIQRVGLEHRFQPYANGEAAIMALSAFMQPPVPMDEFPLVCFLDIKMVGMSGLDLLKWIRGQKALEALPVIMYSSSDHPQDVDTARELGAQAYVRKYPSVSAMQTLLDEARTFALSTPPKKTFLQWSYRFVETSDATAIVK